MMISKEDVIEHIMTGKSSFNNIDLKSIHNVHIKGNYVLIKYLTKDHQYTKAAGIPLHYFKEIIRDRKINEILNETI